MLTMGVQVNSVVLLLVNYSDRCILELVLLFDIFTVKVKRINFLKPNLYTSLEIVGFLFSKQCFKYIRQLSPVIVCEVTILFSNKPSKEMKWQIMSIYPL